MESNRTGEHAAIKLAKKQQRQEAHNVKRKASITSLFDNAERVPVKRGKPQDRAPELKKPDHGFLTVSKPKPAKDNELYRRFAEAEQGYMEGATISQTEQIEQCCETLVNRVKGVDADGNPLAIEGVPTAAQWEALDAEAAALSKPLQKEVFEINFRRADGQIGRKTITLEETETAYNKKLRAWRAARDILHKKRQEIQDAVDDAWDDYENDRDGVVKNAHAQHQLRIDGLLEKSFEIQRQTEAEIKAAQKEDRDEAAAYGKKFQELLQILAR